MKTKLFLLAIPCILLVSCNSSGSKDAAAKEKADSLTAKAHMDSLMNASNMLRKQDSLAAAKAADSTKKADSAKAKR